MDWKAKLAMCMVILGAVAVAIVEPKEAGKMVVFLGGLLVYILKREERNKIKKGNDDGK